MRILAIETSCDETAMAVLEVNPLSHKASEGTVKVLSNTISSQVKLHAKYGGVVPNLAAREHVKNIGHVFKCTLKKAGEPVRHPMSNIDLIAVTHGPGLGPALLVGISFAKTLAWKYNKPVIGINHLEGHIYSNWLPPITVDQKSKIKNQNYNSKLKIEDKKIFPVLNLIVSGGHTELVLMEDHGKYELIGETLDDAVGEAFDKVARLLGLGYPGGPTIAARAAKFKVESLKLKVIEEFPRPMLKSKDYNFSYSGLKTAVLYKIRNLGATDIKLTEKIVNEICYEFQNAAIDVLIQKTIRAAKEYKVKSIMLSGGVSANTLLRFDLGKATRELGLNYSQPELEYTGDNAAMIALAGYLNYTKSPSSPVLRRRLRNCTARLRRTTNFSWKLVEMDANLGFK